MRKLSRFTVIASTLVVLGTAGAVGFGIHTFRKAPLADNLADEATAANKKLNLINAQAHEALLLCISRGAKIATCKTEEAKTIVEASKPVSALEEQAQNMRFSVFLYGHGMGASIIIAGFAGLLLCARRAFQKRREQTQAAQAGEGVQA